MYAQQDLLQILRYSLTEFLPIRFGQNCATPFLEQCNNRFFDEPLSNRWWDEVLFNLRPPLIRAVGHHDQHLAVSLPAEPMLGLQFHASTCRGSKTGKHDQVIRSIQAAELLGFKAGSRGKTR